MTTAKINEMGNMTPSEYNYFLNYRLKSFKLSDKTKRKLMEVIAESHSYGFNDGHALGWARAIGKKE